MSNLVRHAKKELELAGLFEKRWYVQLVIKLRKRRKENDKKRYCERDIFRID